MTAGTSYGALLALAVSLPVGCAAIGLALGGRWTARMATVAGTVGMFLALAIAAAVFGRGEPVVYLLGGWAPPLGIGLRADGLSAAMLLTTALVMTATMSFARDMLAPPDTGEARAPTVFWCMMPALWSALNTALLANDLFTLFVALELLTFAAVPLVCLDGSAATLAAALRYLLFALLGSLLYLLGTALLYGAHGTLDIVLLSQATTGTFAERSAAALMVAGLLAKIALFPLHLWLPPAHAGAPAPASAALSALVVKGPFVILLRVWFGAMGGETGLLAPQLLATLGACAILFGSVLALRQARLKMLVAYSTVAQLGYMFLMFPLVRAAAEGPADAWTAGAVQMISHAFAKAAMFLAVGLLAKGLGHDRIDGLGGAARAMPVTVLAFAIAGLSLMGLPPSGGFVAKWLLLLASVAERQWWWAVVVLAGGLLTGSYVYRVLAPALSGPAPRLAAPVPRGKETITLWLAIMSMGLGFLPLAAFGLLQIGRLDVP